MAAECFGLHPLIREDILNVDQCPTTDTLSVTHGMISDMLGILVARPAYFRPKHWI